MAASLAGKRGHGRLPVFFLLPHGRPDTIAFGYSSVPQMFVGLFTIYGHIVAELHGAPAGGPHLFMSFNTPCRGPAAELDVSLVETAEQYRGCVPQRARGRSLYLLLVDWQHWRRRILVGSGALCRALALYPVPAVFNYFVDLIAGVAVALVGWWTAQKFHATEAARCEVRCNCSAILCTVS